MSAAAVGTVVRVDLTFGAAEAMAWLSALLGLVAIAVAVARTPLAGRDAGAQLAAGLGLGLEFFLAAGLLRLSRVQDVETLGMVALVILLRKLTTRGVGFAVRALGARPPGRLRA